MSIDVQLNNTTAEPIEKSLLEKVITQTLMCSSEGMHLLSRALVVSVAVVSSGEIAKINKDYRKKDAPTDVLSFGEYEDIRELLVEEKNELFLGELIICPEYIRESANQQYIEFENELVYITAHGMLHLLGYDHGDTMFHIQDQVVEKILKK